jgi:uncharacterized membrane protein
MFDLPSLSSWDALHPSLSHFPIALLLLVPFCLAAAIFVNKHRQTLLAVAFGLTLVGMAAAYFSASTGDAARDVAQEAARNGAPQTAEVKAAVQTHEDLASVVRAGSTVIAVLLAALLFGPQLLKRELKDNHFLAGLVVLLVLCLALDLVLLNTAHTGGLLVHKLGMHAPIR